MKLFQALQYNVPNGKKIRGLAAVNVFEKLIGEENLTPEIVRMGHIMGWCMEIVSISNVVFTTTQSLTFINVNEQ